MGFWLGMGRVGLRLGGQIRRFQPQYLYFTESHFYTPRDGFRFGGGFRGHENDFRGRAEGNRAGPFDHRADRGFVAPHVESGGRPGAFSGFDHGGVVTQHSFRGQSSFGGGMRGGVGGGCMAASGGGMRGGWWFRGRHAWWRRRRSQVIGICGGKQFLSRRPEWR